MMRYFTYLVVIVLIFGSVLTSCEEQNEYTVSFDSNQGSAVLPQTVIVKEGEKVARPDNPIRDGYAFVAWYKEAELINEWTFDTDIVTANIELYAKWESDRFTVSFNSNGGGSIFPQAVKKGEKAIKPRTPTLGYYVFVAWYKEAELINEWIFDTDIVTANITLHAKWELEEYTVYFESNGGSSILPQTIKGAGEIIMPDDPIRSGYEFVAWFEDEELTHEWYPDIISYDRTLYAAWHAFDPLFKIDGLTIDNYPRVDGSTSTDPLNILIAGKLLDIPYRWVHSLENTWYIRPYPKDNSEKFRERIGSSQTHQSFINLIDNKKDLILSARTMSPDEKKYAGSVGVSLIETPIALDAFIFVVHPNNSIKSLTVKQIQDIYTGKISNWKEVGGNDAKINPYVRNANSGSQELMESFVMKESDMLELPESLEIINSMAGVFDAVSRDVNAICYTIYYYKEQMIRTAFTKSIAIEGVYPDKTSIQDLTYPLVAEVYAGIRSDLEKSSMAYKLYELLQAEDGKKAITESGYVLNLR